MRKRHPNTIGIRHNPTTGLYEIVERGITYAMPMELTTPLKAYFAQYTGAGDDRTVAEWYGRLCRDDQRNITRTGAVPNADNSFYPDVDHTE